MLRWLGCLASAIPCFLLAGQLLRTWFDPLAGSNGDWVRLAIALMALEFLALHAGALCESPWLRSRGSARLHAGALVLALLYGSLTWGVGRFAGGWTLAPFIGLLGFGRLVTLFTAGAEAQASLAARATIGTVLYVPLALLATLLPIPALGLTPRALERIGADASALLEVAEPGRVLAMGIAYFAMMGLAEVFVFGPARNAGLAPVPACSPGDDAPGPAPQRATDPALAISTALAAGASSPRLSEK